VIKSKQLKIQIFADGANKSDMLELYRSDIISGLTTNPTLMKKAGIINYEAFCRDILDTIVDKPISFEVFSDEFTEMERQARLIASWGDNVYVKIPITNSMGEPSAPLIKKLVSDNIKVNVTAIMTAEQVKSVAVNLNSSVPSYVSVFAGRIADTGVDPLPIMKDSLDILRKNPKAELIWASPREVFNVYQGDQIGCHVITVTRDLAEKLASAGKDLEDFSLETVRMFAADAEAAGYTL